MPAKKQTTTDDSLHPDFIRYVIETYRDDPNGYMVDILGLKHADWQDRVGRDLVQYRRVAVSSGHGIGKTTFGASMMHWFLATRSHPAIVATANTENQLSTKLWRELAKLNQNARNGSWFDWQATRFSIKGDPTSFAAAIPWSENNAEAFAGTHEDHVLGLFDEASAIPPIIWTTFSGAMSTDGARWLALGNPTQNTGQFYEICHGKLRWRRPGDELLGLWRSHVVASWESPFVSKSYIEEQRFVLGEDSDEWRVRVCGLPPQISEDQLINRGHIDAAVARKVEILDKWPLILGVDVARQGTDRSSIVARRGNVVLDRIHLWQGLTLKQLAWRVADEIRYYREEHGVEPSAVFIEGGGSVGWGVIEELWELGFDQVRDVNPGTVSAEPERFVNKRCEMWGYLKEWFESERVHIPNHTPLIEDLCLVKRKPDASMRLRLESKDEMRRRSGRSPDAGDALALTFAFPVEMRTSADKRVDSYGQSGVSSAEGHSWMSA